MVSHCCDRRFFPGGFLGCDMDWSSIEHANGQHFRRRPHRAQRLPSHLRHRTTLRRLRNNRNSTTLRWTFPKQSFRGRDVGAAFCNMDGEKAYLLAMTEGVLSLPTDELLRMHRPIDIASMPLMQLAAAGAGCAYLAPGTGVAVVNQVSIRLLPDTADGLEVPGPNSPLTNLAMVQILPVPKPFFGQGRGLISPDMVVRNRQPRATTAEPQPESEPQTQPAPQATSKPAQPEAQQSAPPEATFQPRRPLASDYGIPTASSPAVTPPPSQLGPSEAESGNPGIPRRYRDLPAPPSPRHQYLTRQRGDRQRAQRELNQEIR